MQLFSKWICRFLKGDEEKKEGEESGIHNYPPQTGILCMCMCVSACRHVCISECFLKNLYLLFSEAHIIFGNGIKHKKSMKNAYSLFLRVPLFTFQPPEGPFLLQSRRHRCTRCLTGPKEAGSGRRKKWSALGGVGMLLSSPQLLASSSLLSNAIPVRQTLSHTNSHRYTHVEEFWLHSRAPMGARKGP